MTFSKSVIWIVSAPTGVGKCYFLENKEDRLSKITNLPPFKDSILAINIEKYFDMIEDSQWSENICVHLEVGYKGALIHPNWEKFSKLEIQKKVIILGVSYSEYKIRFQNRYAPWRKRKIRDLNNILDLYKGWIDELNKKEIPYLLVEANRDYKILEEEDFFRMLK
tara:strand:+ start:51 stop:548 length:498 start_codon:yes stop_codon:yes gene_type:complete